MDIGRALRNLVAVEGGLEDLYGWFAELFGADEEASALFATMSREEGGHRAMVEMQQRLALNDRAAFGEVPGDDAPMHGLRDEIRVLRAEEPPPDLNRAVTSALMFEVHGAEVYSAELLTRSYPELGKLMGTLKKANDEHFGRLQRFAEERGMLVWVDPDE